MPLHGVQRPPRRSWLDAIDGEIARVGSIADSIRDDGESDSMALLDGSLYNLRTLSLHPAVQGQKLGPKLIARCLRMSRRVVGDTADLPSAPVRNDLTGESHPPETKRALSRRASYYARIGFCRTGVEDPDRSADCVTLWVPFGVAANSCAGPAGPEYRRAAPQEPAHAPQSRYLGDHR